MTKISENELILKLKEFRKIKPREEWVILTRNEILGKKESAFSPFPFFSFFQHKPAFAMVLSLIILIGLFGFTQSSLPGDILYSLKRAGEQGQAFLVSDKEEARYDLEIVGKRLDDLTRITQTKSAKKLATAINELQASVSKAAGSLAKTEATNNPEKIKELVLEVKRLEEKTDAVKSLGIEIGQDEQLNNALSYLVDCQIRDLENKTLTDEQKAVLIQVKEDYQAGNYSQAMEKILLLNQK